jgi:PAS domain S-box-containing protein
METRVAVGISVLLALSLALVLTLTTRTVTARSLDRASHELEAARTAFARLVANRAEFASAQTRLITSLPVFRAHLTDVRLASDIATLDTMADDYREQLRARFCIVTDATGRWLGSPGWPAGEPSPAAIRTLIDAALGGRPAQTIVSLHRQLFLVISEPARFAQETLGSLTIGYPLDDGVARELAVLTHAEVNLATMDGELSGSSLPETARAEIRELVNGTRLEDALNGSLAISHVGDVPYVAGAFRLASNQAAADAGRLVLLQDWRPTQQFLDDLRRQLLLAGIGTFGLALAAGVAFSRRMSRPLKDIAQAAGEIASGHWSRQVPSRGSAEATTTATAFNEMTSHLRHWHEQAEDRAKRLEASRERFQAVTEAARDGIVSTDAQGVITFWNSSASTIFGYRETVALGTRFEDLLAESDRPAYRHALAEEFQNPSRAGGQTIELTGHRQNGTQFPVELSLSVGSSAGQTLATAVVRDVTERKQNEDALRQRESDLRHAQKMDAIGQLAGGVAHDFNNLLMAIQGYGELVLQDLESEHPCRGDVGEIIKAANRASALTRQLLAFSRRQVLEPQVLALEEVVTDTEKLLRRLIGEDIETATSIEPGLGLIRADRGQIEQVLVNLAVNARDAMPGGGRLSIALRNLEIGPNGGPNGLTAGRYVRIEVSDTGCGMPPEVLARIFEPFFTTKEEGRGTGLGLAMVYGIVQQSGGVIGVESHPGRGTRFRIDLPRCEEPEAVAPSLPSPTQPTASSETVLLVEDDVRVRGLVSTMLRRAGHIVLEAEDAKQALDIVHTRAGAIDLLLTDVVLSGLNGRALAERLQTLLPTVPVLFMSGHSDQALVKAGVQTAGMAFLRKPFSSATLAAKIREVLGKAAASGARAKGARA